MNVVDRLCIATIILNDLPGQDSMHVKPQQIAICQINPSLFVKGSRVHQPLYRQDPSPNSLWRSTDTGECDWEALRCSLLGRLVCVVYMWHVSKLTDPASS